MTGPRRSKWRPVGCNLNCNTDVLLFLKHLRTDTSNPPFGLLVTPTAEAGVSTGQQWNGGKGTSQLSVCLWFCAVAQSCPALYDPMDCSPSGSFVRGISQVRILAWVAISSSRGSSRPGIESASLARAGGFFTTEPSGKYYVSNPNLRKQVMSSLLYRWRDEEIKTQNIFLKVSWKTVCWGQDLSKIWL